MVVDEQTHQLREKDHLNASLREPSEVAEWERKYHELQQTMLLNNNQTTMSGTTQLEIMELKNQIEDLREKLAVEFNKKRKMKLDYEEKIANLNEELHFFKEVKYPEMRELLSNCNEQLREFEDLNLMRNEVIEKLEKENAVLKSMIQAPPNRQQYFI